MFLIDYVLRDLYKICLFLFLNNKRSITIQAQHCKNNIVATITRDRMIARWQFEKANEKPNIAYF